MHQKRLEVGKIEGFLSYALFELTSDWGTGAAPAAVADGASRLSLCRHIRSCDHSSQQVGRSLARMEQGAYSPGNRRGTIPFRLNPTNSNIVENALYFFSVSSPPFMLAGTR